MSGSITIRQPKPLPGSVPWDPPYQYDCSRGHEIGSSKPVKACPIAKCDGTLKRFGTGSQGPRT
jgi:hypothetical protein